MKNCKFCKSDIDEKATVCPFCHKKQSHKTRNVVLIIVAIFFILGIISTIRNDANNVSSQMDQITNNARKGYSTNSDLELEEGYSGSKDNLGLAYYIEGYIKNNTSNNYSYVQVIFTTYDKDGNTIGTCLDNNSGLEAKGRWKFKAMCLDQISDIASYKLKEISKR